MLKTLLPAGKYVKCGMSKTALLFAGQGAQVVGMGKIWPKNFHSQKLVRPRKYRAWLST
jgi:hypothetical protein